MSNILITGAHGFLGKHLTSEMVEHAEFDELFTPSSRELDLLATIHDDGHLAVTEYCAQRNITDIIHLAANCGGIGYNQENPGRLIHDNLAMGMNVLEAARSINARKVVLLGTVCMYPNNTPVPFSEDDLWNGYPESTNAPYGIAKKAISVMSQAYQEQYGINCITLIPVNMAGEYDHFEEEKSHVIPALIRRFEEARLSGAEKVVLWGTGRASREFLFVRDCARGIRLAFEHYSGSDPVNLGSGREIKISELATMIAGKIGYTGSIVWDDSKPDGQPRRCLDVSRAKERFGFEAQTGLSELLDRTIEWYRGNIS